MIDEEDYKKWKPLIEEYEKNEVTNGLNSAMYCTSCQALEAHDCLCDEEEEDERDCSICSGYDRHHEPDCPYNTDPFDNLITNGYD